MKGERKLGSFDQPGNAYNKPVKISGDFENQGNRNPISEKKNTTPNMESEQQKPPKASNKNETLPGDTKQVNNPDRTPIGFKQKSNTSEESALAPETEKPVKRPRPIGPNKLENEEARSSAHAGPKGSLEPYDYNSVPTIKSTELTRNKRTNNKNPIQIIGMEDDTQVADFFASKNQNSIKPKKGFAQKKPLTTNNDFRYTSSAYKESQESKEYFKKKDQEKKSKLQQKTNKLVSTVFPQITKDELENIDATHLKKLEKREEAKMLREAKKMVRNISEKSIETPTPQTSKIVWPAEGRRITNKEYTKPTPSKNTIFPIKNAQRPIDNKKESNPAPVIAPEKSEAEQFLQKQITSLLKGGMDEQDPTILMLKNELKKEQGKNTPTAEPANKIVQEKTTTPRVLKPRTLPRKSLNETLDEIEKNARDSIQKTSGEKIEKALEGNQEEIVNLTLRINQFNTIQEKIKELKEKRRLLTESTGTSYDQKLVDQIDEEIQKAESLSPYKSKEEEEAEVGIHEKGSKNNSSTKTVNESYTHEEKNINDTFAPTEKSVAEAYEDGTLNTQEKNSGEKNEVLNEIPKSPELLELESARKEYAEKQKKFLDNHRKTQNSINKIRDFFGFGKKIKEEQLPEELKNLKSLYDQKKVAYGKSLIKQHISEIENKIQNGELEDGDKDHALEQFIKGNVFDEVVVKERESLLALQAETLPAKEKGIFKKALDGYLKLKPWQRTVISTTLITGAMLGAGTFASTGAAVSYGATRLTKSTIYGATIGKLSSTLGGQAYDAIIGDTKENSLIAKNKNSEYFFKQFEDGDNFENILKGAEMRYEKRIAREKKEEYGRIITKTLFGIGTGVAASGIGPDISHGVENVTEKISHLKNSLVEDVHSLDAIKNTLSLNTIDEIKTGTKGIINNIGETSRDFVEKINEKIHELSENSESAIKRIGESQHQEYQTDSSLTPAATIPAESIKPISDTLSTQAPKEAVSFSGESSFKAPEAPHDTVAVNQPTSEPSQPKISEPISTPKPEAPLSSRTETISVEADKLGAIETFKDLKEKLVASYPDPKLAPANVREILEGDPTALATKYGFYNPSQGAESALMHKGEQLGFDTKGNLYFKDTNGTVDYLSEQKGFDGKMIDTNHVHKLSVAQEMPQSINPNDTTTYSDNTQKIESVDPNDYTDNSSITEKNTANLKSVNPNEDVGFRQNTFYTKDPEIDAMTPTRPQELPQQEVTAKEFVESLNTKEIHSLAEQEFNKDINSMFQKPNFLLGGSTPGMKTEEWAKTLSFIENNKVTGNHLFEALETGKLQNSDQGEFFTLGEYARSLRAETGLAPREGELLKDYFIRANEYKITHHITDKEVGDMLYGKDDSSEPRISEETRQKINARARRSVETDGVYN